MIIKKVLTNRNFILVLALSLGLALGNVGDWIRYLTIPALSVVMMVSFLQVDIKDLKPFSSILKPFLYALLLNYLIYGLLVAVSAKFLVSDQEFFIGFIVLALSPGGVAIAPFTGIMKGDMKFSLIGMVATYIASIIILPLGGIIFIGQSFLRPLDIVLVFLQLIIGPFLIAQVLIKLGVAKKALRFKGPIVNWGLFVVIFTVISLNRDVFLKDLKDIAIISAISATSIFATGLILELVLKKLNVRKEKKWSLVLLGTVKNTGFGAATALALVSDRASVPSAVTSVFLVLYLVMLGIRSRKLNQQDS